MPSLLRVGQVVGGALLGLVLVEGALQLVKIGVSRSDASRTDHAQAAGGGDLRVLCLGACYTIGVGTPPEAAYPRQLEGRLDRQLAEQGVDAVVINGGQRGKSIDHFSADIEPLLEAHEPDVLVVAVNRRTSLDPSPPLASAPWDALLLPRLVALAWSTPVDKEVALIDPLEEQIRVLEARLQAEPGRLKGWGELSALYVKQGDYAAARDALAPILEARSPTPPPLSLRLFRYATALGEMEVADAHMARVRAARGFPDEMRRDMAKRAAQYASDGRDVALRTALDEARLAAVEDDRAACRAHLDTVLDIDPDTADAWHLVGWLDHLDGRPPRPRAEAFLGAERAAVDIETAAFETALDAHVGRIVAAAERTDTAVVLHTLAAAPAQLPTIRAVAARHHVPVIDVQAALQAVPDPEPLFHPTDHLRFSEAGNAWLAEQVHQGLIDAGLVPPG